MSVDYRTGGLPAEIVEILLVESEDDVSEVVNVRSAGFSSHALHDLHEESLPVIVYQRYEGFHFSRH